MTTLIKNPEQHFLNHLLGHFTESQAVDLFKGVTLRFWEQFSQLGLPSKNGEIFRYVPLKKLYEKHFLSLQKTPIDHGKIADLLPKVDAPSIVLVNGEMLTDLCQLEGASEYVILPMQKAMKGYGSLLNNQFQQSLKMEKDPFVLLNGAFQPQGVMLYFPRGAHLSKPLHIFNYIDAENAMMVSPRVQLFVGRGAEIKVILWHRSLQNEPYFSNQVIELLVEEGAKVQLNQITLGCETHSWIFDAVRATLKRASQLHTVSITEGAETHRSDYIVQLLGEGAEASLNGLCSLNKKRQAHTSVLMDHQAPNCQSRQLFKKVLDDQSRSSFVGEILVRQDAQKTNAFQLNNNLLISDQAAANSKPNLQIFADDVKASHGATVGQLSFDELFYLQARGYTLETARKTLVQAFSREITNLISDNSLQQFF